MKNMPPMKNLGKIAKRLREQRRLSLEEVANEVPGYDAGNLSRFENQKQGIAPTKLEHLAKVLGSTVSQMARLAEEDEAAAEAPAANDAPHLGGVGEPSLVPYSRHALHAVTRVPVFTTEEVGLLAQAPSAVDYSKVAEHIFAVAPKQSFAWKVLDDSMTAPPGSEVTFPVGHYAVLDPSEPYVSGDACLIWLGTNCVFTRLVNAAGVWMMAPLNDRYPARELPINARVVAVAVGSQATFRRNTQG